MRLEARHRISELLQVLQTTVIFQRLSGAAWFYGSTNAVGQVAMVMPALSRRKAGTLLWSDTGAANQDLQLLKDSCCRLKIDVAFVLRDVWMPLQQVLERFAMSTSNQDVSVKGAHASLARLSARRHLGCESKTRSVAGPPTPCCIPLCHGLLLHTFVANAWRRYALQKNLVAKVLVASQEILLQTYVAEWPPKPVANPVFLIHSHL